MAAYNSELGASSMAMSFGARPKLLFLFQWFAILMGLASLLAALPVAALSFAGWGLAALLAKVAASRSVPIFLPHLRPRPRAYRPENSSRSARRSRPALDGLSHLHRCP